MKDKGIQFQEGMSFYEFLEKYGTDDKCAQELARHRWPNGFKCLACGTRKRATSRHAACISAHAAITRLPSLRAPFFTAQNCH